MLEWLQLKMGLFGNQIGYMFLRICLKVVLGVSLSDSGLATRFRIFVGSLVSSWSGAVGWQDAFMLMLMITRAAVGICAACARHATGAVARDGTRLCKTQSQALESVQT